VSSESQLSVANYAKDSYIVVEGRHKADCFFIIQQGKVLISREVTIEGKGNEVLVPGDFFGVVSAMSSHNHIETAQALTDVVLIAVRPQQYVSLIQNNIPVATKILMQFSKQLRALDKTLTEVTLKKGEKNVEADGPHHLFAVAEYYVRQKQYNQAFYAYTKYLRHCPKEKNSAAAANRLEDLASRVKDVSKEYGQGELNRSYKKDEMLFAEGEPGDEFFVIQKGSIKITKIVDNKEVLLATLKSGDIFGEMALLEGKPRAASALAGEDCSVMAVNKANFELMIKNQPQLIARVTTLLSDRIWFIFKQLENALIINPVGRMYDALLVQLEKNRVNLESKVPYVFGFTWREFVGMMGLSEKEGNVRMGELMKNKNIQLDENGKIYVSSIADIVKQTDLYRRMDKNRRT